MKKILYTIALFIMFIGITNAAKCNVISGTGKNIGDEIACGTEHFYVISNDGTTIKMLAKYNLLAGGTFEKITIENKDYNIQEFYNHQDIKPKLEQGYTIYDEWTEDDSIVIIFQKYQGYTNKNLIFDESVNLTLHEFLNRSDVKELFEQGYELDSKFRTNIKYTNNQASTADYSGGEFSKSIYYENKIIIFDEPVDSQYQNISDYLASHEEYQKLLEEGYSFYEYYYDYYTKTVDSTGYSYNIYSGVSLYKDYENVIENVRQDETAIGAHGDEKGNPLPIEIGVIEPMYMYGDVSDTAYATYYKDITYDEYSDAYYYFNEYYDILTADGFNIKNISSLTVSDINELVKNITSTEIPLVEWYETAEELKYNQMTDAEILILGSIKELVPEEYSWIWGTTYWLRTTDDNYNIFFIDTLGDLCSSYNCQGAVGAGIRPVIEISATDIIYNVKTKTDGNGTIQSTHIEAGKGEIVKFTITPNEGYVLSEVRVTDSEGNVLTFTDNTFTMPEANVVIEATFSVENSDTSTMGLFIACCVSIIVIGLYLTVKYINNLKWIKQ